MKFSFYFLIFILAIPGIADQNNTFFDQHKFSPQNWEFETTQNTEVKETSAVNQELSQFFESFNQNGITKIYIGWGKDAWEANRFPYFAELLRNAAFNLNVPLLNWRVDYNNFLITFINQYTNQKFEVQGGHYRNEFIAALKDFDVIIYHGHSRYGRGPAFNSYQNYFRLGDKFETIEVDTRNPHFQNEPLKNTETYPPIEFQYTNGQTDEYQYFGPLVESSKLTPDSLTIQIEGGPKDFKAAEFKDGHQLFFFYSCQNEGYWKNTFRDRFPDYSQKMVFGTKKDSYWLSNSSVMFILSIVREINDSNSVVRELEASNDNCVPDCYTSY